jgi:cell division septum initiation protein DivIVA
MSSASSASAASSATLNIVELIEKNPITKLSQKYNNLLLNKLQENFNTFEQQLFVASFYCYLNYDKNTDYIVDLDDVWKWLGFAQKINVRTLLEKNFKFNVDYTVTIPEFKKLEEQENTFNGSDEEQVTEEGGSSKPKNGGQNKQTIKLTIRCFKLLCLKAQTKKAGEIHQYYMKMEETLHQILDTETSELRAQLEQSAAQLEQKNEVISTLNQATITLTEEKKRAIEQTLISQFPVNTQTIYFGTIDNTNADNEKLIKFGQTNDLATRVADHHKKYTNFILAGAFRVTNRSEIENNIKSHPKIKRQLRTIEVAGKNKTEIIAYDSTNFTIARLTKHIEDIIHATMYNVENFNRLIQRNQELEAENAKLVSDLESKKKAIHELTLANNELKEKTAQQSQVIEVAAKDNASPFAHALIPGDELNQRFNEFVTKCCIVRPDVDEESVNIEGRFRLWSQTKPAKDTFHALKHYMDVRFKQVRLHGVHCYQGVKLNTIEYKKVVATEAENPAQFSVETFIFQCCQFSDRGKILNSTLLKEYQQWKISVGQTPSENDMKNLKTYLNACKNTLKATIWSENTSNEGYYGLGLRQSYTELKQSVIQEQGANPIIGVQLSTTGKKVEKRLVGSNQVLKTWSTIAKASESEGFSTAKMSRSVKDKTVFNDYYYCVAV